MTTTSPAIVKTGERILRIRSPDLENCSIEFTDCDHVVEDLATILRGWEIHESRASPEGSVIRLRRTAKGYLRVSPWSRTPSECRESFRTHHTDALFGVHYDLLRWYVASQRTRPCLHSAAVRFSHGLIAFPNTTKAGKTTLTIQLAMAGHHVFCDDWLSIHPPGNVGMSLGILPWLRLPAPIESRDEFKRFLKQRRGPRTRRWMYVNLHEHELSPRGVTAPIAELVLLDRQPGVRARLISVDQDTMLTELIQQNYALQVPSTDVFDQLHALTRTAGCFRLRYESVLEAVELLNDVFDSPTRAPQGAGTAVAPVLRPSVERYSCVTSVSTRRVGKTTYLLDTRQNAIHQLNRIGAAIWDLLGAPKGVGDLIDSVHHAFPGTAYSTIEHDIRTLLDDLIDAKLIART